ncbi:hypothetical protein ACFWAR_32565 [Streptomyces sp. NPDC059917]|uniref:hypothetical protein n=1 Tax=Streptomyces sp. NPDC059917 TaxID=3347002 RepID=UPI0036569CFB
MPEPGEPAADRAHGLQRALAAIAALDAVFLMAVAVHLAGWTHLVWLTLGAVLPVLAPPFVGRRRAFVATCLGVAASICVWSMSLFVIGVFAFWPTAALLVGAAFADPRRQPHGVWPICLVGVLPRLATVSVIAHLLTR